MLMTVVSPLGAGSDITTRGRARSHIDRHPERLQNFLARRAPLDRSLDVKKRCSRRTGSRPRWRAPISSLVLVSSAFGASAACAGGGCHDATATSELSNDSNEA